MVHPGTPCKNGSAQLPTNVTLYNGIELSVCRFFVVSMVFLGGLYNY